MYRLDVRGLSFKAGSTRIVHDVSVCLKSGELVALLGPSGSGKSTLLRAMTGFRPGTGKVELCGRDLVRDFDELKTLIGFVPQDDVVHDALRVGRTLEYAAQLRLPDVPDSAREHLVRTVLAAVELSDKKHLRVKSLSGGQRKRVSIAVELLAKPPLLILDEPTSGLDPALEEKTMKVFRDLTGPDRLTIVTTHVLASLDIVDLVIIVCRGRMVFIGPPKEAAVFFGAASVPAIYKILAETGPETWVNKLAASNFYRELVLARLATAPPNLPTNAAKPSAARIEVAQLKESAPVSEDPARIKAPAKLSAEEELARLKAAKEKAMKAIDSRQASILSDRYLEIVIGDIHGTALLLVQAPLIAAAIAGVWSNVANDTLSMYFVLSLSAFFLGAVNSCREIVKERALFLREKMFNLSVGAYLVSKYRVQLILIVIQCVLLTVIVKIFVPFHVNIFTVGVVLLLVALAGTAVGLLISAWVKSADKAVAMVPLIVIPQILFSDFVLGEGRLSNWTAQAQKLMPVHWGYKVLRQWRLDDSDLVTTIGAPLILMGLVLVCFLLSLFRLARARY